MGYMHENCGDCEHCTSSGYCDVKDIYVDTTGSTCSEFEER